MTQTKVDQSSVTSYNLKKLAAKFGSFPTGKMLAALMCASEQINLYNYPNESAAQYAKQIYKVNVNKLIQWLYNLEEVINDQNR